MVLQSNFEKKLQVLVQEGKAEGLDNETLIDILESVQEELQGELNEESTEEEE